MSRKSNIKWRASDEEALKKAVRNFNQKIYRLEKKNPDLAGNLPERVKLSELRNLIETRQDFNREINALRRFSRKNAADMVTIPNTDNNIKMTRWEKNEIARRTAIVNQKRARRKEFLESLEILDESGQKTGYTRGQLGMGDINLRTLEPTEAFPRSMTNQSKIFKFRSLRKESATNYYRTQDETFQENFMKALDDNFEPEHVEELKEVIAHMDPHEFAVTAKEADVTSIMDYAYPFNKKESASKAEGLKAIFKPEAIEHAKQTIKEEKLKEMAIEAAKKI